MIKGLAATLIYSAGVMFALGGSAYADVIVRYECSIVGSSAPEPVGDRSEHNLINYQFSCFGVDGLMKGAVYTASQVSEWDGSKGTFLLVGGVHRTAGGLAVTQMLEGTGSLIIKDEKPVGSISSGKATFKFASGTLVKLSGKTFNWKSKSTGPNRFELEWTE
jgi:hypothetical protein